MVRIGPDIAHTIGVMSRYLVNLEKELWAVVQWILGYLKGLSKLRLCYGGSKPLLEGYRDADMAGDIDSRKFSSRYQLIFFYFFYTVLVDIDSPQQGKLYHGSSNCRSVLLFPGQSQNILQLESGQSDVLDEVTSPRSELGARKLTVHCDGHSAIEPECFISFTTTN